MKEVPRTHILSDGLEAMYEDDWNNPKLSMYFDMVRKKCSIKR